MFVSPRTNGNYRHRQRRRFLLAGLATALTAALLGSGASASAAEAVPDQPGAVGADQATGTAAELAAQERLAEEGGPGTSVSGRWVVQLAEPSLAVYQGGIAGLPATSPEVTGAAQLDTGALASRRYGNYLASRQQRAVDAITDAVGEPVTVTARLRNVLNALVVELPDETAAALVDLPQVAAVYPDQELELTTDASHDLIGTAGFWDGRTGPGVPGHGEGVVVGLLDSGINPFHPSFAATDGDGFTHTNPYGEFLGVCDPDHPDHDDICNDKLVGAWTFVGDSALDTGGHGSHTASTAAGNRHQAGIRFGGTVEELTLQGVAPRANIIAYKTCAVVSCSTTAILSGIDQAIADGVDVLNYSISGADRPWRDSVSLAFLEAAAAGIFVSASAGNDGPDEGSANNTAPWNATVAATTQPRVATNPLTVAGRDPVRVWPGTGPAPAADLTGETVFAGEVSTDTGCRSYPENALAGRIVLVQIGVPFDCPLATKVGRAADAGAIAVLLWEEPTGPPISLNGLEGTDIPAFHIDGASGASLIDHLVGTDEPVSATVGAETTREIIPEHGDQRAWFSSQGPSEQEVLAPTYAAPGVNVLAADAADGDDAARYFLLRGTSMAAPHVTGAGALLAGLHPRLSPTEINSALALTAEPDGLRMEDGTSATEPFDVGSGRIDLAAAARIGLVMDETIDNFRAADPREDGDPKTLNLPSLLNQRCSQTCTFQREVTSVADGPVSYTTAGDTPDGMAVTVDPPEFTLAPGATQRLEITVDATGRAPGEWSFGGLRLVTTDRHPGGEPVASVRLPVATVTVAPEMVLRPAELTSTQRPAQVVNRVLAVVNEGNGELRWRLATEPAGCDDPADVPWLEVSGTSGTSPPDGGAGRIPVSLDSTGLAAGDYTATLCVTGNDPVTPQASAPVRLTVEDAPVVTVGPEALAAAAQPAGTRTATTLTIGNDGTAPLTWQVGQAEVGEGPPGVDPDRLALLREGVLLSPDSNSEDRRVQAFHPRSGDLIDADFFALNPQVGGTPNHLILHPDGERFLVSVQTTQFNAEGIGHVVHAFDLNGEYQGIFAPAGGQNLDIMENIRGMAISPQGTILVGVARGPNGGGVAEFDLDGNYLGNFIAPGAGGLESPWSILVRDSDILVGSSGSQAIHRYDHQGNPLGIFHDGIRFPQQLIELPNGNLLMGMSIGASGEGEGVWEFTADGEVLGIYTGVETPRGVYDLPNGNILTSSGPLFEDRGMFEIDRGVSAVDAKVIGPTPRFITPVQLERPCDRPGDIPWLDLPAGAGTASATTAGTAGTVAEGVTRPGERTAVPVVLDSTGLAPGEYQAHLCVTSDDPDRPLVSVPLTMTVTGEVCDRTITGIHTGPVTARRGLTCLAHDASVLGPVRVGGGASLHASGATVSGGVRAVAAARVELRDTMVDGPVAVIRASGPVELAGNHVRGPVSLLFNQTDAPAVVSGNRVIGALACTGNEPPPTDRGVPNTVQGAVSGQCAPLVAS